jgi:NAD(P)-dependent dehydrogenase (short-subunit alcohol dehydrogenase family)
MTTTEASPIRFATYPSLAGRACFVTGGASGIGEAFVRHLAAQSARVVFVDVDDAAGEALCRDVADLGHCAPVYAHCDVRDIVALQAAIADAAKRLGPVRVLVNNAANDTRSPVREVDQAIWDERMAVNLRPHFFAAQAVAPMMKDAGGGSIINLGSISAHIDLRDLLPYITAKAGIEGLTRILARELGGDRIRVNCLIPGWTMTQRQLDNWVTPDAVAAIERNQSLPDRVYPEDVARLMLWLAADDSRLCTGQNWIVDGGWM